MYPGRPKIGPLYPRSPLTLFCVNCCAPNSPCPSFSVSSFLSSSASFLRISSLEKALAVLLLGAGDGETVEADEDACREEASEAAASSSASSAEEMGRRCIAIAIRQTET